MLVEAVVDGDAIDAEQTGGVGLVAAGDGDERRAVPGNTGSRSCVHA